MGSPIEKCTFTWTVHNFNVLGISVGDMIKSTEFKSKDSAKYEWSLELYPMGEDEADYVVMYLVLRPAAVYMRYMLAFRDANNREIENIQKEIEECSTGDKYRVGSIKLERHVLLKGLRNSILKIHVKASVHSHITLSRCNHSLMSHFELLHFYTTKAISVRSQYSWVVDFNREVKNITSNTFTCSSKPTKFEWCLSLKDTSDELEAKLILRLWAVNNAISVPAQYTICIKNTDEDILLKLEGKYVFAKNSFTEFDLGTKKALIKLLHNGILIVHTTIMVTTDSSSNLFTVHDHAVSDTKLISDFQRTLLFDEKFADVHLVVGEERLPAHRAIIAARSPVFLNMLKHHDTEKVLNGIEIKGFSVKIVQSLMKFMYTGIFEDILIEDVVKLLCVAHQYEVEDLKRHCENFLLHEINTHNAVYILFYAKKCNAQKLELKAMEFITSDVDCYPSLIGLLNVVEDVVCYEVEDFAT